ncbi:MAG TPA: hypothetical protein PK829_00470 [Promineifilum sp.]|nr:hypothetical protein [Promineifilum sp.]HQF71034.1 hypothetical protein [Promineifilum sp.]
MKTTAEQNGRLLTGCALVAVLLLFALAVTLALAIRRDRDLGRYPGATPITSHSNYSGLPRQFRWDNSYFTTDSFNEVDNWYSVTFGLGAESRAMERCILLEGPAEWLWLVRDTSVLLCNAPEGQLIYVTRTTRLR